MYTMTRVQILDNPVYISHINTNLRKGMNTTMLPRAMGIS